MIKVIALIGEAGTGKDYLLKHVMKKYCDIFHEIISMTTRPKREGEEDGVNYHFLPKEEFEFLIQNNKMLEYTEFRGWYYGTCIYDLSEKKVNIGVFNPDGIRNLLKNNNINLTVIRLVAFDKTRLIRQLEREHSPDVDEIVRRYLTDKQDFQDLEFNYLLLTNEYKFNLEDNVAVIGSLARKEDDKIYTNPWGNIFFVDKPDK